MGVYNFWVLRQLAHHNDAGSLALQLGHTDTKIIFKHYRAVVRALEAEEYWGVCR